jgi:hypothetical protein
MNTARAQDQIRRLLSRIDSPAIVTAANISKTSTVHLFDRIKDHETCSTSLPRWRRARGAINCFHGYSPGSFASLDLTDGLADWMTRLDKQPNRSESDRGESGSDLEMCRWVVCTTQAIHH